MKAIVRERYGPPEALACMGDVTVMALRTLVYLYRHERGADGLMASMTSLGTDRYRRPLGLGSERSEQ
jgi:hypothetical protein